MEEILRDIQTNYVISGVKGVADTQAYEEIKVLIETLAKRKVTAILDQRKKDHFVRSPMNLIIIENSSDLLSLCTELFKVSGKRGLGCV